MAPAREGTLNKFKSIAEQYFTVRFTRVAKKNLQSVLILQIFAGPCVLSNVCQCQASMDIVNWRTLQTVGIESAKINLNVWNFRSFWQQGENWFILLITSNI